LKNKLKKRRQRQKPKLKLEKTVWTLTWSRRSILNWLSYFLC
jgi:hypothetical protein